MAIGTHSPKWAPAHPLYMEALLGVQLSRCRALMGPKHSGGIEGSSRSSRPSGQASVQGRESLRAGRPHHTQANRQSDIPSPTPTAQGRYRVYLGTPAPARGDLAPGSWRRVLQPSPSGTSHLPQGQEQSSFNSHPPPTPHPPTPNEGWLTAATHSLAR